MNNFDPFEDIYDPNYNEKLDQWIQSEQERIDEDMWKLYRLNNCPLGQSEKARNLWFTFGQITRIN